MFMFDIVVVLSMTQTFNSRTYIFLPPKKALIGCSKSFVAKEKHFFCYTVRYSPNQITHLFFYFPSFYIDVECAIIEVDGI